jgi:hypothetical protein
MYDVDNQKESNGIYMHLKNNEGHNIDWDGMKIVKKERNWERRRIAESICIDALNPGEELESVMNIEKGKKIDTRWKMFNHHFREDLHL